MENKSLKLFSSSSKQRKTNVAKGCRVTRHFYQNIENYENTEQWPPAFVNPFHKGTFNYMFWCERQTKLWLRECNTAKIRSLEVQTNINRKFIQCLKSNTTTKYKWKQKIKQKTIKQTSKKQTFEIFKTKQKQRKITSFPLKILQHILQLPADSLFITAVIQKQNI